MGLEEKPSRRNFLMGTGALAVASMMGAPADAAEKDHEQMVNPERQTEKIPSAEEIDAMTRQVITDAEKAHKSFWDNTNELRKRIFGGGNLEAGEKAYRARWDDEKEYKGVWNLLIGIKTQAEARGFKEILETVNQRLKEAEALNESCNRAYITFVRESRHYFEAVYEDVRIEAQSVKDAANIEKLKSLAPSGITIPVKPVAVQRTDMKAAAENMRQAALTLANFNDQMIELRAKYLEANR